MALQSDKRLHQISDSRAIHLSDSRETDENIARVLPASLRSSALNESLLSPITTPKSKLDRSGVRLLFSSSHLLPADGRTVTYGKTKRQWQRFSQVPITCQLILQRPPICKLDSLVAKWGRVGGSNSGSSGRIDYGAFPTHQRTLPTIFHFSFLWPSVTDSY